MSSNWSSFVKPRKRTIDRTNLIKTKLDTQKGRNSSFKSLCFIDAKEGDGISFSLAILRIRSSSHRYSVWSSSPDTGKFKDTCWIMMSTFREKQTTRLASVNEIDCSFCRSQREKRTEEHQTGLFIRLAVR